MRIAQALRVRSPVPPRWPGLDHASFRNWPSWMVFAPVAGWALLRGARYGDLSLLALANPLPGRDGAALSASKSSVLGAVGPAARGHVAPYVVLARSEPSATVAAGLSAAEHAGLRFPLVAKPDRGTGGKGVRLLRGERDLAGYVAGFPRGHRFLLQELVDLPNEAGIMYLRRPGVEAGRVIGLATKEAAAVRGDGVSTLRALIGRHPHVRHLRREAFAEHRERLDTVPPPGERIELVFARNRSGGAVCHDACERITPALRDAVDRIARTIPGFHIGRLDVRFDTIERLSAGEGFRILEINCGISEPLHAWDPASGAPDLWRAYFQQIDLIFEIGAANRARGHKAPGTVAFLRTLWHQKGQMGAFARKE